MDNSRFQQPVSDYVAFVEPHGIDGNRVALTVKIPPEKHRQVLALCARNNWHTMRFYREAFAHGIRAELAGRSARSADAQPASPDTMYERWREIEAESPEQPCGNDQLHGF